MDRRAQILKGTESAGGNAPSRYGRRYEILAKDFVSVQQQVPVVVPFGSPPPMAGVQITPLFNFREEPIKTKTGK